MSRLYQVTWKDTTQTEIFYDGYTAKCFAEATGGYVTVIYG